MTRWKPDAPGRLMMAAIHLFDEQGYDATTVAEIAERAGLTKRTFFRHFADKREVLFGGGQELERVWVEAVREAPAGVCALAAATAGFDTVAELFAERHAFARVRARVIAANPELLERELIKLETLAGAIAGTLADRGVPGAEATLAAQTAVTVFHVTFARWVAQDDPGAFRALLEDCLTDLRTLTTA